MWKRLALSTLLALVTLAPLGADDRRDDRPYRDRDRARYRDRDRDRRDGRTFWRHHGGGFEWQSGTRWLQFNKDGPPIPFRETDRTDEYVELYDAARRIYVRLHDKQAYQLGPYDRDWGPGARGYWD